MKAFLEKLLAKLKAFLAKLKAKQAEDEGVLTGAEPEVAESTVEAPVAPVDESAKSE